MVVDRLRFDMIENECPFPESGSSVSIGYWIGNKNISISALGGKSFLIWATMGKPLHGVAFESIFNILLLIFTCKIRILNKIRSDQIRSVVWRFLLIGIQCNERRSDAKDQMQGDLTLSWMHRMSVLRKWFYFIVQIQM